MSRVRVPGSVYQRSNGRWAALTPAVFDDSRIAHRRLSLGAFDTDTFPSGSGQTGPALNSSATV